MAKGFNNNLCLAKKSSEGSWHWCAFVHLKIMHYVRSYCHLKEVLKSSEYVGLPLHLRFHTFKDLVGKVSIFKFDGILLISMKKLESSSNHIWPFGASVSHTQVPSWKTGKNNSTKQWMYEEKDSMKSWPLIRTIRCTKCMDFSPSIEYMVTI